MTSFPTPPATNLSTPSPTERPASLDFPPDTPMASARSRPIYLIVATSIFPPLGIGLHGHLPWPKLKSDMSFFRRVTSRPPAPNNTTEDVEVKNAIIMGRKTWDSIPAALRPLRGRVNVVVSRSKTDFDLAKPISNEDLLVTSSLPGAVSALERLQSERKMKLGNTFIIGGSEVYRAAMEELLTSDSGPLRIIRTQVQRKDGGPIKCDTFFPTVPEQIQNGTVATESRTATPEEVEEWVGEELPQRAKANIATSDDRVDELGDWLDDGEMQVRVIGEEIQVKR